MPFLMIAIGLGMMVSAVRDTQGTLIKLIEGDFTGSNNFIYYIAAIGILGAAGYAQPIRSLTRWMVGLVLLTMILENGGVFKAGQQALGTVNASQSSQQSTSTNTGSVTNTSLPTLPTLGQSGTEMEI